MERKIAECSTYKELCQETINLIRFYADFYSQCGPTYLGIVKIMQSIAEDAQQRIDSYELDLAEPDEG